MQAIDQDQFLPARQVWERYGVTSMTLWRWLKDDDLKFPHPMRIGRLRYWRVSDLVQWETRNLNAYEDAEQP
jgi:predicted DNA-binding transcriptional regulator AlpA